MAAAILGLGTQNVPGMRGPSSRCGRGQGSSSSPSLWPGRPSCTHLPGMVLAENLGAGAAEQGGEPGLWGPLSRSHCGVI